MPSDRDYFKFSQRTTGDAENRYELKESWDHQVETQLWRASPVTNWEAPRVMECVPSGSLEDFPWVGTMANVGSDRARRFVEEFLPGHCQFLPVDLRLPDGSSATNDDYWVFNWLHEVDCLDRKMSHLGFDQNSEVPYVWKTVIARDKIPADIHVFRVRFVMTELLFDRETAQAFVDAGLTGIDFHNDYFYYSTDSVPAPPPEWFKIHEFQPREED